MKKPISRLLAVTGVIAFLFLNWGGIRMSGLASQSGNTVAEYYYQSMGTCMIGFGFVAAALLWGLSWMVAAWPDYEGIVAALAHNNSSDSDNQTTLRPDQAATYVEKKRDAQQSFYASLASVELQERSAILQRMIVKYVDQHWRVVSQTQTTAHLVRDKRPNLLLYKGTDKVYLEVKENGQVLEHGAWDRNVMVEGR